MRIASLAFTALLATTASAGGYSIPWFTIDSGGGRSSGGDYVAIGTIGQHDAVDSLTGGTFTIEGGFWTALTPPCPADLDGDDMVDGADLGLLLAAWGPAPPGTAADLNADGVVDGADLGLLLADWGPCP